MTAHHSSSNYPIWFFAFHKPVYSVVPTPEFKYPIQYVGQSVIHYKKFTQKYGTIIYRKNYQKQSGQTWINLPEVTSFRKCRKNANS